MGIPAVMFIKGKKFLNDNKAGNPDLIGILMKIIMTILVRNEENIIEENVLFHKAMGVDGIIITDNCSTI